MTILVTGATGNIGRHVVDILLAAGAPVRATSRNPRSARLPAGVDVRAGDLADPSTFTDALTGVQKVFLFPEPTGASCFLKLAGLAGVQHVVVLSSMAVTYPEPEANPVAMMHMLVEQAVERSELGWTFLRPSAFAKNTLQWAPAIRSDSELRLPYAEATVSPIHERDIAAVAAEALLADDHVGAKYELTGPESVTQRRQAELIGTAIGRAVSVADLTGDAARAQIEEQFGRFGSPAVIEAVIGLLAGSVGRPAHVTDSVVRVTGRAPRTFAEWAVDHKTDFCW